MSSSKAAAAYAAQVALAAERLAELAEKVAAHERFGKSGHAINFAHVGDITAINEQLAQALGLED